MKSLALCLILLLVASLSAQESVFILVDVSGNPKTSKFEIKNEIYDFIKNI